MNLLHAVKLSSILIFTEIIIKNIKILQIELHESLFITYCFQVNFIQRQIRILIKNNCLFGFMEDLTFLLGKFQIRRNEIT